MAKQKTQVSEEVVLVSKTLAEAGFETYLVGGCVRDMLLDREPKDWDVATDAKPAEVQKLFPESVYENDFGTVGIKTESEDPRAENNRGNDVSHRRKVYRSAASGRGQIRL